MTHGRERPAGGSYERTERPIQRVDVVPWVLSAGASVSSSWIVEALKGGFIAQSPSRPRSEVWNGRGEGHID